MLSPSLILFDVLWSYLKNKVYLNRRSNQEEMKAKIRVEVRQITPEVVGKVQKAFISELHADKLQINECRMHFAFYLIILHSTFPCHLQNC